MDTPRIFTIDLTGCRYWDDMHNRIAKALDFPDYYGKNWDAFWDLIRGERDNAVIEIKGVSTMPQELQAEIPKMVACLEDNIEDMKWLKKQRPDFDCRFSYRFVD